MKMIFQVNGREMSFTKRELTSILEEHFSSETQHKETVVKPTEGITFEVKPQTIDQTLFKDKREDKEQERARKYIVDAFEKMKKNPEKYGKDFKTLRPQKNWTYRTSKEMERFAHDLGGHVADDVEYCLKLAQRISNGETWEAVCNEPDTAEYYRLIAGNNGYFRLVGGSCIEGSDNPASDVDTNCLNVDYYAKYTVPLVVLKFTVAQF